ncbi:MAG TPA: NAD-binding protein [Streptosporangiaceae bacterium]|jgi:3-hydroxyisobutyrate dehydrogenase-like beta-hydroxyacid dehydrogenase|nr:NAD-binding protein [Streptosporangiaceae bacterium]HEX2821114.1 NAD-binding protein [Streptosporangiaceae bacterium]
MSHGETPEDGPAGTTERPAATVAVLGAGGTMGFAMARNIARAGIKVRAWNRSRGKAITSGDFTPDFRLELAAKDAGLVGDSAWQHGLDLPLLELVARRLGEGAREHGDKDFSATYLTSAPEHAA